MAEADDLSDELVIIDHGKIIEKGKPKDLKNRLGEGDIVEFKVIEVDLRDQIVERLKQLDFVKWAQVFGKQMIKLNALGGLKRISEIMDAVEVKMLDIGVHENTLEDVFIDLTGRELRE
jgi:ABC-2 type transport system ATP-binding protein